jgi:RHS repeat-associated protein
MDDSLGGLVSYTYDARDELTNETLSGTGISAIAVANTYDNAGNMTGQTRYSNLAETTVVAATSYTYDDANQMIGITDKNSSGTTLVSYGYTFNAAGLVTQEVRTWDSGSDTDTLGYTYTNNDQLTGVTHTNDSFSSESFSYDVNGNETGTGYTTSTGNEQTASPGNTYTYDADGNMITDTITASGDVWTYSYNFAGQMTGAVEKTSGGTVLAQVSYTYDALGNRIGMDENGTQTWTLYDGSTPIIDFNSSGSLEMRYLDGPTGQLVDSVLARESSGGTIAWYLPDRLGTVRDLINNSGSIIDHIDFSAFGTVLDESDASEGDRMMGFAGTERDTVAGLNLAVHRAESPGTGRWDTQDPLGAGSPDPNLYGYVNNDPSGLIDPEGLAPKPSKPLPILKLHGGKISGADPTYDKINRITVADIEEDCEGAKALLATLWFSIIIRDAEQRTGRASRFANHQVIIDKEMRAYNQLLSNFLRSTCGGPGNGPSSPLPPRMGPGIGAAPSKGTAPFNPVTGSGTYGKAEPGPVYPNIAPVGPSQPLPNPGDPVTNPGLPVPQPAPGPVPQPIRGPIAASL